MLTLVSGHFSVGHFPEDSSQTDSSQMDSSSARHFPDILENTAKKSEKGGKNI